MKKLAVGGQAVIEGVMMKSPSFVVTSVRKTNGKIVSKTQKLLKPRKILRLPFIRGVFNLFEMLVIGMKALTWSANIVEEKEEEQMSLKEILFTIILSFGFAILFFMVVPIYVTKFFADDPGVYFSLIEGIIRLSLFVMYIYVISFMSDVRALFQYHGAEHKSVHCYEHNKELTIKNVKKYTTLHTRCGSAFVGIVLILSIVLFSFIKYDTILLRICFKLLLLPVVASVSYELLKFGDKHQKNIFIRLLLSPGMFFQKITTREPNDKQIQVAIHSLKKVLNNEKKLKRQ